MKSNSDITFSSCFTDTHTHTSVSLFFAPLVLIANNPSVETPQRNPKVRLGQHLIMKGALLTAAVTGMILLRCSIMSREPPEFGIDYVARFHLFVLSLSLLVSSTDPSSHYVITLKAYNNVGEGIPVYESAITRPQSGTVSAPFRSLPFRSGFPSSEWWKSDEFVWHLSQFCLTWGCCQPFVSRLYIAECLIGHQGASLRRVSSKATCKNLWMSSLWPFLPVNWRWLGWRDRVV